MLSETATGTTHSPPSPTPDTGYGATGGQASTAASTYAFIRTSAHASA